MNPTHPSRNANAPDPSHPAERHLKARVQSLPWLDPRQIAHPAIREALHFIHLHLAAPRDDPEHVTRVRVAEHAHPSPNYLSRLFRDVTGTTFGAYVTAVRICHALKYIADHPYASISSAALASGFTSLRTFQHQFKKLLGTTPLDYRSEIRHCFAQGRRLFPTEAYHVPRRVGSKNPHM